MDKVKKHIIAAAYSAADLAFKEMCNSDAPLMIAVEDTRRPNVIGFAKVYIAKDYYHENLVNCSNNGKMHILSRWSIEQMRTEITDFLLSCNILPLSIYINNEITTLDSLHKGLRGDIGYIAASRKVEEIQLQHSKIKVINLV